MTSPEYSRLCCSREEEKENNRIKARDVGHRANAALAVSFLISASSLVLSLCLLSRVLRIGNDSAPGVLPRPNPYIGLDRVPVRKNITFAPFVTDPRAIFQISSNDHSRTLREDDRQWLSQFGTVVPEDYHFFVTPETSSIVQFRAMDWGMENCALKLAMPATESLGVVKSINIWRLDDDKELVPHISWRYAPPRRELLASPDIPPGQTITILEFACPSGSFPTFEFECCQSERDCVVDFWQSTGTGVHLVQSWSKG